MGAKGRLLEGRRQVSKRLRVLIVDDHLMFAESIAALLLAEDENVEVADFATSLDEPALERMASGQYDVFVVDLKMPGVDGVASIVEKCSGFGARLAIISGAARRREVELAIQLGVDGFIPKTMGTSALLGAIKLVAFGGRYFPVEFLSAQEAEGDEVGMLSARERLVLEHIRQGASNKVIGGKIGVEESVVKAIVRSLCARFGVSNRTALAMRAIEWGF